MVAWARRMLSPVVAQMWAQPGDAGQHARHGAPVHCPGWWSPPPLGSSPATYTSPWRDRLRTEKDRQSFRRTFCAVTKAEVGCRGTPKCHGRRPRVLTRASRADAINRRRDRTTFATRIDATVFVGTGQSAPRFCLEPAGGQYEVLDIAEDRLAIASLSQARHLLEPRFGPVLAVHRNRKRSITRPYIL